jgi:hypothetical protein
MRSGSKETNLQKQIKKRNLRLQRKVSLIIASNLAGWVPFLLVSILHAAEVVDANPFYPVFSLFILPINSVINPIILNDLIAMKIQAVVKRTKIAVSRHKIEWLKPRKREEANPGVKTTEKGDVIAQPMPRTQLHVAHVTKNKEIISNPSREPHLDSKIIDTEKNVYHPLLKQNQEAHGSKEVDNVSQAKNLPSPNLEAQANEQGVHFCQPLPVERIEAVVFNVISNLSISEPSSGTNKEEQRVEIVENYPELQPGSSLEEKLTEPVERVIQLSTQTCVTANITHELENPPEIIPESDFKAQEVTVMGDRISQLMPEPNIWAHEIFLVEEVDSITPLCQEVDKLSQEL